jgi:hypothetical protein
MNEDFSINAILEDDLIRVLNSQGLLKQLQDGLIRCMSCGCTLKITTIGSIHIINGEFHFKCDSKDCAVTEIENK